MAIPLGHWMRDTFSRYPLRRSPDNQGGPGRTNTLASGQPTTFRGKLDPASAQDAQRAGRETSVNLFTLYTLDDVTLQIDDRVTMSRTGLSYKVLHRFDPSRPDYIAWVLEGEKASV